MKLLAYVHGQDGLVLETTQGRLRLQAVSDTVIRATYTLAPEFSTRPSLVVLPRALASRVPSSVTERLDGHLEYRSAGLRVRIDPATMAFSWYDRSGRLLAREPERGGKTLVPFDLVKYRYDDAGALTVQDGPDGQKVRASEGTAVVDRTSYHTKLEFVWQDGEALYGLGSHEDGVMNLRGSMQYLYQQNMKVVVPCLLSTRGYGLLWDSCSAMRFRDDAFGSYVWTDADEELDFYFMAGDTMDEVVASYRDLTGGVPMLPRWAFGYAQSKERYKTQEEILEVAAEYRRREIPLDLIVLDWRSWVGELWGQKTFDAERFPDPAGMVEALHAMGIKFMISIWPIMINECANQLEMRERGFLLGNRSTYDAFNPEARALYWKQANEGLFSSGLDAWWCDCTEPFEADWNGAVKPEPEDRMRINCEESARYLDREFAAAYSLLHSEGIYRGQRSVREDKRVVVLTRSGYAGQQRWSTIVWSGDCCATWESLRKQIPAGLNFCAAGLPWWTTDIGAFFVARKNEFWFWHGDYPQGVTDPLYRELYLRWFQFGAFLPMFRSHGTDTPREVWRFGEKGEPIYDSLVEFIRLRARLLPYLYSVAGAVSLHHGSMMKPLAFAFPSDAAIHDVGDQYLFGPVLMPCPVVTPLSENGGRREVRLPAGADWYDFWTGKRYDGGQTISIAAPLDVMPLFVRSGSILPLGPVVQHAAEAPEAGWEIRVYPGADGRFTVYEDSGDGYAYEHGEYGEFDLAWNDRLGRLEISGRRGSFPGMATARDLRLVLVGEGRGAGSAPVAGSEPVVKPVRWNGEPITVALSE